MKDKNRSLIKRRNSQGLWLFLSSFFFVQTVWSQSQLPVLSWRTHFSYHNVVDITDGSNRIYASTPNAIFTFNYQEQSIDFINKNTGLSDVGIGAIEYDESRDRLIIAYENGNIDFWSDESITNINTVKETETVLSKRFRHINIQGNLIYFSGDLGIIVFDLSRNEIVESYQNLGNSGESVVIYETAFTNDSIYAVSDAGILSASLDENINRQDFNNWRRTLTGLSFQHITEFDGQLFASSDSDLFNYTSGSWGFEQNYNSSISELLLVSENTLYLLTSNALWVDSEVTGLSTLYTATDGQALHDVVLANGDGWIASSDQGLLQFNAFNVAPQSILPPGPVTDLNTKPAFFDGAIYWISETGGISNFNLEDQRWTSFNTTNEQSEPITMLSDIDFGIVSNQDIDAPVFSSSDQGLFFGGSSGAAISINESFSTSSPLPTSNGSFNVTAIASDSENILWTTTTGFSNSLYSWNPTGDTWTIHQLNNPIARFPRDLFITPEGDKWLAIEPSQGGGIIVFDDQNRRERYLNTNGGQGGLPGSEVTSMVMDQNFFLWVGTNQGIAFFPNPSIVLENQSLTANVPIFENRLLLRDEFITQIAIDPANRKWFGTQNNGLWLFSETGEALVYHFTADNSPLPSNQITSLYLDPPSGELFINTDKGMVSFRSDATEGTNRHENVQIYPNPVNPSFQGEIVINGLVNNVLLKITDVSGKLVREVRANGSTALWNSRDINGKRVNSGVYLIFSSSADGSETFVGKIVVI